MRERGELTASSRHGVVRAVAAAVPTCLVAVLLLLALSASAAGCAGGNDPSAATTLVGPPPETTSPSGTTPTTAGTASNTTSDPIPAGTSDPGATDGAPGGTSSTEGDGTVSGDLETLRRLAISQYQAQDLAAAARTYQAMLALDDTDPLIHNNYANVLRDLGRSADAEREYERALSLDAALVTTYLNLAALHLREQDREKALSVLDRGIAATTGADRSRLQDMKNQIAG